MAWVADWVNIDRYQDLTPFYIDLYNAFLERRYFDNVTFNIDADDIRYAAAEVLPRTLYAFPGNPIKDTASYAIIKNVELFFTAIFAGEFTTDTGYADQTQESSWQAAHTKADLWTQANMEIEIGEPVEFIIVGHGTQISDAPVTATYLLNKYKVFNELVWVRSNGDLELSDKVQRQGGGSSFAAAETAWDAASYVADGAAVVLGHFYLSPSAGSYTIRRFAGKIGVLSVEAQIGDASGDIERVLDYYLELNAGTTPFTFINNDFSGVDEDEFAFVDTKAAHTNTVVGGVDITDDRIAEFGTVSLTDQGQGDFGYDTTAFDVGDPSDRAGYGINKFDITNGFVYVA